MSGAEVARPPREPKPLCWAYLMRCGGGSLYAGWTNDLSHRAFAHKSGQGGAKYTKAFRAAGLAYAELCADQSAAMHREAELKKLTKAQKEALCTDWADEFTPRLGFAVPGDAAEIAEIYNWYVTYGTATFRYEPLAGQELADWLSAALATGPIVTARTRSGRLMAFACAHPWRGAWAAYQWDVETTVYAAPEYRAFGAAGPAYGLLLAVLAEMGYWNAYAVLADPNPESERFHERRSFVCEGRNPRCGYKFGRWLGISTWRYALHKGRGEPVPVQPLPPERLQELLAAAQSMKLEKK